MAFEPTCPRQTLSHAPTPWSRLGTDSRLRLSVAVREHTAQRQLEQEAVAQLSGSTEADQRLHRQATNWPIDPNW